jgi:hypothetical protein
VNGSVREEERTVVISAIEDVYVVIVSKMCADFETFVFAVFDVNCSVVVIKVQWRRR